MKNELILYNGKITIQNLQHPEVNAIHIKDNKIAVIGSEDEILSIAPPDGKRIDLNNRRV